MSKLLLHSCCAPCSTTAIERLKGSYDLTIYYFNPNIEPYDEYIKRKNEQIKLLKLLSEDIKFIDGDYPNDDYHDYIEEFAHLGENTLKCYKCMEYRLNQTARIAKEQGFDVFATTLSVSPYKNSAWIKEIGNNAALKHAIDYLDENFKEHNGYQKSRELSRVFDLYRQNYCGCLKSKNR